MIHCSSKRPENIYDESLYLKVDSIDEARDGELFVSSIDSNRKLIKYYWPDGKIQLIGYYYKGLKEGNWRIFMDNGVLVSKTEFFRNKRNGRRTTYHANGKIATAENYSDDFPVGVWSYFDTLGILFKSETY